VKTLEIEHVNVHEQSTVHVDDWEGR